MQPGEQRGEHHLTQGKEKDTVQTLVLIRVSVLPLLLPQNN